MILQFLKEAKHRSAYYVYGRNGADTRLFSVSTSRVQHLTVNYSFSKIGNFPESRFCHQKLPFFFESKCFHENIVVLIIFLIGKKVAVSNFEFPFFFKQCSMYILCILASTSQQMLNETTL